MPETIGRPRARRARRFARSSCLTVRLVQPAARRPPRVSGRRAGSTLVGGTGGERTTGPGDRQTPALTAGNELITRLRRLPPRRWDRSAEERRARVPRRRGATWRRRLPAAPWSARDPAAPRPARRDQEDGGP